MDERGPTTIGRRPGQTDAAEPSGEAGRISHAFRAIVANAVIHDAGPKGVGAGAEVLIGGGVQWLTPSTRSFSSLPQRKKGRRLAFTVTASPVFGLRPR